MKSSKSSLFLMELILAFLFFSLAGAVCIQLFVKAHLTSEKSTDTSRAVVWAQTLAEDFYGCTGNTLKEKRSDMEYALTQERPDTAQNDSELILHFNDDWQLLTGGGSSDVPASSVSSAPPVVHYMANVRLSEEVSFYYADISVTDLRRNTLLYTLSVKQYRPERREN